MAINSKSITINDGLLVQVTDEYIEAQKGHLEIPGYVTHIGGYSLAYHANLKSVIISDSVDFIYINAFKDCANLQSVTIPASIKGIHGVVGHAGIKVGDIERVGWINAYKEVEAYLGVGESIFSGCNNLSSIIINTSDPSKEEANKLKASLETNYPGIDISIEVTCQVKSVKKNKQTSDPNKISTFPEAQDSMSIDSPNPPQKNKADKMLDFAIAHPALVAGVVGALVCAAIIVTIVSMGIGGVGVITSAGAIAAGVGANIGLSATASAIIATAIAGVTTGLVSSCLTFFGLKVADSQKPKSNQEELFDSNSSYGA